MRLAHLTLVAALGGLILIGGCASPASTTNSAGPASSAQAAVAAATPAATAAAAIPTGYTADRDADADISSALATAGRKHQEVLLDFGADWCPDCVALDSMFHSAEVAPLLTRNYIVVPVDVGDWNLNLDVAAHYVDLQTSGIPALVVLTASGKALTTTNDGSFSNARTMTPSDVAAFLSEWAPSTSADD